MNFSLNNRCFIVAALFCITIAAELLTGRPAEMLPSGLPSSLPSSFDKWIGRSIYYCQDPQCGKVVSADIDDQAPPPCACGKPTEVMSYGEKAGLPQDTGIMRKVYADGTGKEVLITAVTAGKDRAGIHRPEWCLPAQGYRILSSRTVIDPFAATVFTARKQADSSLNTAQDIPCLFAFWFKGGRHNSGTHLNRLFWTAWDSIIKGRAQQWAYISIFFQGSGNEDADMSMLKSVMSAFSAALYPSVQEQKPKQ